MSLIKNKGDININSYSSLDLFEDLREYLKKSTPYKDLTRIIYDSHGMIIDKTLSNSKLSLYIRNKKNHIQYVKKNLNQDPKALIDIDTLESYKYNIWQRFGYLSDRIRYSIRLYKKLNKFGKVYRKNPNFKRDYFKVINTQEKAYCLGFLFADGSINTKIRKNKKGREKKYYRLKFSQSIKPKKDRRHIDKKNAIMNFLKKIGLEKEKIELYHEFELGFRIQENKFCHNLIKLGFIPGKKKSKNIMLPDLRNKNISISKLRELYLAFLLGYYDGDGTKDSTRITSGSKIFLEQIKCLFSIKNKIGNKPGGYYLNLGPKIFNDMMDLDFKESMKYLRRKFKLTYNSDNWNEIAFNSFDFEFLETLKFIDFIQFFNRPIKISFDKWVGNLRQKILRLIAKYESEEKEYSMAQLIRDIGGLGYSEDSIINHSGRIIKNNFGMTFKELRNIAIKEFLHII